MCLCLPCLPSNSHITTIFMELRVRNAWPQRFETGCPWYMNSRRQAHQHHPTAQSILDELRPESKYHECKFSLWWGDSRPTSSLPFGGATSSCQVAQVCSLVTWKVLWGVSTGRPASQWQTFILAQFPALFTMMRVVLINIEHVVFLVCLISAKAQPSLVHKWHFRGTALLASW